MPWVRSPFLLRRPDEDGFILIEDQVIRILDRYRQRSSGSPESGGILLGYRRELHLHVTEATVPLGTDIRSRTRFFRSADPHRQAAHARWRESGGTMDYVGEWHTHPEINPSPSTIDRVAWERICNSRKAPMLFIIAGTHDRLWIGLGVDVSLHRVSK
jgi:integrative and conjugative element protein (TIGR02256 family)